MYIVQRQILKVVDNIDRAGHPAFFYPDGPDKFDDYDDSDIIFESVFSASVFSGVYF